LSTEVLLTAAIVGTPFIGAGLIAGLRATGGVNRPFATLGITAVVVQGILLAWFWATFPRPIVWRTDVANLAGVGFGFYVDDLSLLFAVLVSGMGLLTLIYSTQYVPRAIETRRASAAGYYGYTLLFIGSMFGMIFADNLVQLYVFWDLMDVASFLLIGLNWRDPEARYAAVKSFAITALGGLAVLISFVLIGSAAGTFSISDVLVQGESIRASPFFGAALILLLTGALTKSAQFPFHVWLPNAMVAPTPINAFLDSAALVAGGVYLLTRFHPVLAETILWQWSVTGFGLASVFVGGILALKARDFKIVLAYSTISQYGFMFILLGYASGAALFAALFFFFQHALIKAGLFFAVGGITVSTGLTAIGSDRRLWPKMAVLVVASATLALSMGGIPPFAGFWMKEAFLEKSLTTQNSALIALAIAGSALTLAYTLRFLAGSLLEGQEAMSSTNASPAIVRLVPLVLAGLTLLFGLWPDLVNRMLIAPATLAVLGEVPDMDFTLHLSPALLASVMAISLGVAAIATFRRWEFIVDSLTRPPWSLDRFYASALASVGHLGRVALRLQNGILQDYIFLTLTGLFALIAFSVIVLTPAQPDLGLTQMARVTNQDALDWVMVLLLLLTGIGTILTFTLRRHVHVILAFSSVGFLIAGIFALQLAPNPGLVQVHVETLVTVLFITSLASLPHAVRERLVLGPRKRLAARSVAAATVAGLTGTWVSWIAIEYVPLNPIGPWYNENAPELTEALDVVAAILVHFRALDTFGEIIVFAIATAGVYALVRLIRREDS
jgi:NADH:ubiquinone oxidoreductase subunit 5 (subunit L)/multisubunit Na+/H+ antiporter MnhA subunit